MLPKALLAAAALVLSASPVSALWPVPRKLSTGNSTLVIDPTIEVTYNGQKISYTANYQPPKGHRFNSKEIVQAGISRTFGAIFQNGFVPWMLRQPHSEFEPRAGAGKRIAKLSITQSGKDNANTFKPVAGTVDESYTLKVTEAGQATITAVSSTGVLRALETFSQLFFKHSSGTSWYTQIGPISIEDEPKFPHRGVLLDVGRHWFSVDDIKRSIDGLAMNKLNVLHLHVTETQSWPLEIPALPLLAKKGAYAPGLTYSPADIQSIYEYGVHRGVQVIMEIDMPGHVGIEKAYPGLTVAYDERPYEYYCAQPPCGAFKLNNTKVEKFIDTLFEDLLPRISPYSSYFHTGGDEYRANNSILDPDLKTNDMAVLQPLLNRFLSHVHDKIRSLGLIPMVWEEMVLEWNATVADDVVIQSWLGAGAIKRLAESGHKVIDSSYDFYYLDCGRGQWQDFQNGPRFDRFYPFNDWCDPAKNWRLIYSHDPAAGVAPAAVKNVLGGEVAVWTETIDATSLDSIMWPRAGAAAEVWWSGRVDENGVNRSQYDARPRLSEQRERMLSRGVRGTPITQLWCDQQFGDKEACASTV